jgi:ATP-dependent DNA ligase
MKRAEKREDIWLQFKQTNHNFTVSLTGAYGRGTSGASIPLGGWDEVSTKLEQAGFSRERIDVLKQRLEDHADAIVGPVNTTVEELAILGIRQAA